MSFLLNAVSVSLFLCFFFTQNREIFLASFCKYGSVWRLQTCFTCIDNGDMYSWPSNLSCALFFALGIFITFRYPLRIYRPRTSDSLSTEDFGKNAALLDCELTLNDVIAECGDRFIYNKNQLSSWPTFIYNCVLNFPLPENVVDNLRLNNCLKGSRKRGIRFTWRRSICKYF